MSTPNTPNSKTPWFKNWKIIAPVVVALGIFGAVSSTGESDDTDTAAEETTTVAADSDMFASCDEVHADGLDQIDDSHPRWNPKFDRDGDGVGCETAQEETEPETVEEVEEMPADITDAQVEEWAKSVIGFGADTSWQDAAKDGAPTWAWTVNSVTYGKGGNVVFNMQLDRKLDKPTAENVAKLYANSARLTPPDFADSIDYIIVENGAGEHITQERI